MPARDNDGFFADLGSFLGTWGLGLVLVRFQSWSGSEMSLLSSFLLMLTLLAGCNTYFSTHVGKRFDASHIFIIALSGLLCSIRNTATEWHLGIVSLALVLVFIRNIHVDLDALGSAPRRRGATLFSPLGCSIIFPALLAKEPGELQLIAFSAVVLGIAFRIAEHEHKLALSIYPIGAVIYLCLKQAPVMSPWAALVAGAAIVLVYFLRQKRKSLESMLFERRLWMDEVTVVFSLSLLLRSISPLPATDRYFLITTVFLVLAMLYSLVLTAAALPMFRRRHRLQALTTEKLHLDLRRNSAFAAASVALTLAIRSWDIAYTDHADYLIKICGFSLTAIALLYLGRRLHTFLLADLSKIIGIYAIYIGWDYIGNSAFQQAPPVLALAAATVEYASVAFVMASATVDMHADRQGAWQGIFDPRSLVHIRRSRTSVFDFISKTPMVGWIVHFTDKIATSLHTSFGKKKTWTISHYAILTAAWLGLLSTGYILKKMTAYLLPAASAIVFGNSGGPLTNLIIIVFSIFLYSAILYLFGATLNVRYLRLLAFIMAATNLLYQMFSNLGSKTTNLSLFFYLAVFFSIMGIFAILYRQPRPGV